MYRGINPNSLDNKGSCWILKDCYCSVTMLRELGLKNKIYYKFSASHIMSNMDHLRMLL